MAAVSHRKKITPLLLAFIVSLLAGALSWLDAFSAVDRPLYDILLRSSPIQVPEDIAIIAIDETSINALGRWPWSRELHAGLLGHLDLADAIFFDVLFSEKQDSVPFSSQIDDGGIALQASNPQSIDQLFAASIAHSGNVVLPVLFDQVHTGGQFVEVLPLPEIADEAAAMGHVHVDFDSDGISRGVYLKEGVGKPFWPHVMLALATTLNEAPEELPGIRSREDKFSPFYVYRDHYNLLRFFGRPGSVATVSYVDVLEGRISREHWRGKRVFIGATAQGIGDYIPSPAGLLAGVEFNANVYEAIRQEAFIFTVSPSVLAAFNVGVVLLITSILSRLPPTRFLLMAMFFIFAWIAISAIFIVRSSVWFSPVPVIFSVLLFYPLWSWRRIEIALSYLRGELFQLKSQSEASNFSLSLLQEQLVSLAEIGVLESWNINTVDPQNIDLWPEYFLLNGRGIVNFKHEEGSYRLEFVSPASEHIVETILQALFADLADDLDALGDSYELVEKTVKEIYQVKGDAEKSQARLNNSLAKLQDAVLITDLAGKILFANNKIGDLFGDLVVGSNIVGLAQSFSGYNWVALLRSLFIERTPIYQELDTPSGRKILSQAAIIAGHPEVVVFVFTDVTQLRRLEQSKNEALAFLSHDMRSPIVSLLSLIESYHQLQPNERVERVSPEKSFTEKQLQQAEKLIEKIEYFARRNLKYSEDFLQLARAENIDREVFQLVDMHGVVDGAYAEAYGQATARKVKIEISRPDADCWVSGDAQLLERAVVNLLNNAISHTREGGAVSIELLTGSRVELAISDQGPGIGDDVIPHLFEPYFRARRQQRSPSADERKGFGLGLSFVDTVVKRLGGEIQVDSELGFGTTFRLILPAAAVD